MKIAGIQKVTLIDYPEKIACTIFLYGCNFKCGFCHNPELVIEDFKEKISKKEITDFLKKRKKHLEGVCITGGEPLINLEKDFLEEIKKINYEIKIDTNGSFPEKLNQIINENLVDYIAMDIKSSKEKYNKITNSFVDIKNIEKSIKLIHNSGLNYEFRTTIVPEVHNKEEIKKIAEWLNDLIGKPKRYVLQGFKNQGKFIDEKYKLKKDIEKDFLEEIKKEIKDYFQEIQIRV